MSAHIGAFQILLAHLRRFLLRNVRFQVELLIWRDHDLSIYRLFPGIRLCDSESGRFPQRQVVYTSCKSGPLKLRQTCFSTPHI